MVLLWQTQGTNLVQAEAWPVTVLDQDDHVHCVSTAWALLEGRNQKHKPAELQPERRQLLHVCNTHTVVVHRHHRVTVAHSSMQMTVLAA